MSCWNKSKFAEQQEEYLVGIVEAFGTTQNIFDKNFDIPKKNVHVVEDEIKAWKEME